METNLAFDGDTWTEDDYARVDEWLAYHRPQRKSRVVDLVLASWCFACVIATCRILSLLF